MSESSDGDELDDCDESNDDTDPPRIRPNPVRSRPETQAEYGIPADEEGMLSWEFVTETMADAETFWVATTRPDGRPHTRPVWGVWVDGRFHCGGGERTRWVRNLAENPAMTVHSESGTEVIIIEGTAETVTEETADTERLARIDAAYEAKYDVAHGTPVFAVRPETVLAWRDYPTDATRWEFQ